MDAIGKYAERVRILKRVQAPKDALGQKKETWPETAGDRFLWCKFRQLSGNEKIAAGGVTSNILAEVKIHGPVMGVEAVDRLSHRGTVYKIDAIFFDGFDTVCTCTLPQVVY
jgi:SPP1 family predicted phage head-tail adaptor